MTTKEQREEAQRLLDAMPYHVKHPFKVFVWFPLISLPYLYLLYVAFIRRY
jgi:hypothetical protein